MEHVGSEYLVILNDPQLREGSFPKLGGLDGLPRNRRAVLCCVSAGGGASSVGHPHRAAASTRIWNRRAPAGVRRMMGAS
jgi:hypothetical protein